mgnify:CR=1 FL=1
MFRNLMVLSTGELVGIIVAAVVAFLLIVFLFWYVSAYNRLQRSKNFVEEGWATIDVQLKKRYDLIPNLVETVKGYAKHESETLQAVVEARSYAMRATTVSGKIEAENALSGTLKSLMRLQEAYPQLKANANFISLQEQLLSVENEIASARRYYNGTVRALNNRVTTFPSNLVARRMKMEKYSYFELDSEEERQNVKVRF